MIGICWIVCWLVALTAWCVFSPSRLTLFAYQRSNIWLLFTVFVGSLLRVIFDLFVFGISWLVCWFLASLICLDSHSWPYSHTKEQIFDCYPLWLLSFFLRDSVLVYFYLGLLSCLLNLASSAWCVFGQSQLTLFSGKRINLWSLFIVIVGSFLRDCGFGLFLLRSCELFAEFWHQVLGMCLDSHKWPYLQTKGSILDRYSLWLSFFY